MRVRRLRRRLRQERGAVAIMFCLFATMLMVTGAMAVDLGNAYQRQREVQSQADLAALAAAASLPNQANVLSDVCKSAVLNPKVGESSLTCGSGTPVLSSTYTPTGSAPEPTCPSTASVAGKPYVFFFSNNAYKIKVCSPPARVSLGLAKAIPHMGNSVSVVKSATVSGGSPGASAEMPFYTVVNGGCSWGYQALTDPAHGQSVDSTTGLPTNLTPPTASPSPKAWTYQSTNLTSLAPVQIDVTATGVAGGTAVITGKTLQAVDRIGLYRESTYTPNKTEFAIVNSDSTGKTVTFTIPATVANNAGLWYVRTFNDPSQANKVGWSDTALVLRVGDPLVVCPDISSSGNFGSLKLPRWGENDSTVNGWMPNNIAAGLKSPFGIVAKPGQPQTCSPGGSGVIYSPVTGIPAKSSMHPDTNCVATDTGLTATATTAGLITGTTLFSNGRLANKATSTGVLGSRNCGPSRSSASRTIGTVPINNDTLTCFMTDPTMPISTIASSTYSGGAALDPAIFDSPRFCYVPVIQYDAAHGQSFNYSVIDMRPCFITGESNSSTWNSQAFDTTFAVASDNGITMGSNSKVKTLGVVLFNRNALPATGGGFGNYIGVGPVSVQLTN